jgi:hypothetical protein
MKYINLFLVALISTSCATTPQVYWDTQIIDSGTGEWRTYELEDKLDGNSLRSSVGIKSNNFLESDAYIVVDSDPLGNVSVGIFNGDSYICDYGTSIRLRFEGSDLYELSSYYDYTISAKKNAFILNNKRDTLNRFLSSLSSYDSVVIETNDSCGTRKQLEFNISGKPHVTTKRSYIQ